MENSQSTFDKNIQEIRAGIESLKKTMEAKNEEGLYKAIKEARANFGFTDPNGQPLEPKPTSDFSLEAAIEKRRGTYGT